MHAGAGFAVSPMILSGATGSPNEFLMVDLAAAGPLPRNSDRALTTETHAMQATRNFVGILVKLAAGMQHRHNHLNR
jgi:hypothetical protein